jgi:hypothetical protein
MPVDSGGVQQELLGFVLEHRARRLSTPDPSNPDSERFAYGQSNNTIPVLRDGRVRKESCPLPWGGFARGLAYEWGSTAQSAFEDVLSGLIDKEKLDRLSGELGVHWVNASNETPFFEVVAPGISDDLHDLGKTRPFRSLRYLGSRESRDMAVARFLLHNDKALYELETNPSWEVEPASIGDSRFTTSDKPMIASARPATIVSRGLCEYFSRSYAPPELHEMTCAVCGSQFWPQAHDSESVARIGPIRYCISCLRMRTRDVWTVDDVTDASGEPMMIRAAQAMYESVGMIPMSTYPRTILAGLPNDTRDLWLPAMMVLPSIPTVNNVFGSWAHYLEAAGLLTKASRAPRGGYRSIASDGHLALSLGERFVCDWLSDHSITHEKEPRYPRHPDFNPDVRLRADWVIGDCWVELAGRMNITAYEQRMANKRELAKALGLSLLVLLPHELPDIEAIAVRHWGYKNAGLQAGFPPDRKAEDHS